MFCMIGHNVEVWSVTLDTSETGLDTVFLASRRLLTWTILFYAITASCMRHVCICLLGSTYANDTFAHSITLTL